MRKDFSQNVAVSSKEVAESLFSGVKPTSMTINIEKKKVMLRMDLEMYDALVAEAKADHRSLNAYILHVLDGREKLNGR